MFKKPVIVAAVINIKGIGCRGWLAPMVLAIRLAEREGKKRICGGGYYSSSAVFSVSGPAVEACRVNLFVIRAHFTTSLCAAV